MNPAQALVVRKARGAEIGKEPCSAWRSVAGILSASLLAGLLATSLWPPRPVLIWNASPSSTTGLYRVRSLLKIRKGDMVVAVAPEPARRLAATRGYLPYKVPLIKQIAAVPGDSVCAHKANIFIDRKFAARRLAKDLRGRPLPWWQGCRTLREGEAFLLSEQVPRAFDGRYFGITKESDIAGEAVLLWAR